MKNINILLNLLIIASSITTLDLKSAAHSSQTETKEDIDLINSDILINAILNSEKEFAIKLIQSNQINLNFKNEDGNTALHIASLNGFYNIVKLLLQFDVEVNIKNHNGWPPFMYATENNKIAIAKLLLKHGADVNAKKHDGVTSLMIASNDGKVNFMKLLIECRADVNAKNEYDETALMFACGENKIDAAKLLIEHGANVNDKSKHNLTALLQSTYNNNIDIAKLLLTNGADVNSKNYNGSTPLIIASLCGFTEVVKLLLEYDADINATDKNNNTTLDLAMQKGHPTIANLIKDKQTQNEYRDKIFKAYEQKDIETCKLLLIDFKEMFPNFKPFIMLKNKEKNSLLHEAVIKRDHAFIDYILNDNPEILSDLINMPNKHGMTSLDLAVNDKSLLKYFMDLAYPGKNESCCIIS